MRLLVSSPGRPLERHGNVSPREMAVQGRRPRRPQQNPAYQPAHSRPCRRRRAARPAAPASRTVAGAAASTLMSRTLSERKKSGCPPCGPRRPPAGAALACQPNVALTERCCGAYGRLRRPRDVAAPARCCGARARLRRPREVAAPTGGCGARAMLRPRARGCGPTQCPHSFRAVSLALGEHAVRSVLPGQVRALHSTRAASSRSENTLCDLLFLAACGALQSMRPALLALGERAARRSLLLDRVGALHIKSATSLALGERARAT